MATRKEDRIYLRASRRQHEVIARAADTAGQTVSAFILSAAVRTAEEVLADRRVFLLSDEAAARFEAILERPAQVNKLLLDLLREPTVLER